MKNIILCCFRPCYRTYRKKPLSRIESIATELFVLRQLLEIRVFSEGCKELEIILFLGSPFLSADSFLALFLDYALEFFHIFCNDAAQSKQTDQVWNRHQGIGNI